MYKIFSLHLVYYNREQIFNVSSNKNSGDWMYSEANITVYVTVFWKTDHIDTKTEIHLLPVHDRHTHALSRNTKH